MRILLYLVIASHLTCILSVTDSKSSNSMHRIPSENIHISKSDTKNQKNSPENVEQVPLIIVDQISKQKEIPTINIGNITNPINAKNDTVPHKLGPVISQRTHTDDFKMQSGALLRGFYVLLGITMILLMYLGIRMFRLRKGSKPPAMVRKYGILASRGDVEMLPLPLSEDEDDDTVFELNNHINT